MSRSASLAMARVMAHCGGAPGEAMKYLAQSIAQGPDDPEPYELLAELRRESPEELAGAVTAPSSLWQFVAGAGSPGAHVRSTLSKEHTADGHSSA